MRDFFWGQSRYLLENSNIQCMFLNPILTIFKKKRMALFGFLTTSLSSLGLVLFNSILALLIIRFFNHIPPST
jgi:hypothetical protein